MNEHWTSLCPGCFEDKRREAVCPHCGYDESAKRGPLVLPHRTLLQGQYLVGRVLGKPGGFGITYLAYDTRLETRVAIKEYLPRDLAGRESSVLTVSAHSPEDGELFRYGLEQFLREARTLAKFDHAHVVRVRNVFEENGTAYLVMDYYDGTTLADYLHRKGKLPEKTALDILMPILDGLREVHDKGFLHRDIKPQNIYLTHQGRPILLDFGSARVAMGERSKSLSVVLSAGYAPFEQYHRRGDQGPWTDIYSCAAVLYQMVTGETPPEAPERSDRDELVPPQKLAPQLSAHIVQAILRGLALKARERPQTVREFQDQLMQRVSVSQQSKPGPEPAPPSKPLYAGFWKRAGASVVDGIVLLMALGITIIMVVAVFGDTAQPLMDRSSLALMLLLSWLYFAGLESSANQATVGKLVLGIKVCDLQGQRLSFWRASGRYFSKFASSLFLMVGFMMAGFTKRKQALHDKMACCLVVDRSVPVEPLRRDLASEWGKRMSPLIVGVVAVLAMGVAVVAGLPLWSSLSEQLGDFESFRDCPECPEMVRIPGGEFWMGSDDNDPEAQADEKPRHYLQLMGFNLGKYEVTHGEFAAFVADTGYQAAGCSVRNGKVWENQPGKSWRDPGFPQTDDHPVTCVSFEDAMAYIGWLNQKTGETYRLPTEAEWEYAARAGTTTLRYWGNSPDATCDYDNVSDQTARRAFTNWAIHDCDDGYVYTAPVGSFQPNGFGLYDMLGNLQEWTCSTYAERYDGSEAVCAEIVDKGLTTRGGTWKYVALGVRSSYRNWGGVAHRDNSLGFRLAKN